MRLGAWCGVVLAVFVLNGCAPVYRWSMAGADDVQLRIDSSHCEQFAIRDFPPVLHTEMVAAGYYTPVQTTCREVQVRPGVTETRCTQTGGNYVQPQYQTVDANDDRRANSVTACLEEIGWRRERYDDQAGRWVPAP